MNTNDLEAEYKRIIKICQGTVLEKTPWKCVKYLGLTQWLNFGNHPNFKFCNPVYVKFALGVLEGKPMFIGNRFYNKVDKEKYVVIYDSNHSGSIIKCHTGDKRNMYIKYINLNDGNHTWNVKAAGRS
tara:strand:+ start:103 stop:486 length:384 start_codon:yes stop_codon:yes gene_type:complete